MTASISCVEWPEWHALFKHWVCKATFLCQHLTIQLNKGSKFGFHRQNIWNKKGFNHHKWAFTLLLTSGPHWWQFYHKWHALSYDGKLTWHGEAINWNQTFQWICYMGHVLNFIVKAFLFSNDSEEQLMESYDREDESGEELQSPSKRWEFA